MTDPSETTLPRGCMDADARIAICSLYEHHFWFVLDATEDNATIRCPEPGCNAPIHVYSFEATVEQGA